MRALTMQQDLTQHCYVKIYWQYLNCIFEIVTCMCFQSAEDNTPIKSGIWSCVCLGSHFTEACFLLTLSKVLNAELY